MARMFEIAFQLAGRVNSSFNSTFQSANQQLNRMNANATGLQEQSNSLSTKLAGVGKAAAGIGLAAGAAALAVGGLAVNVSDDLQKSLNGVQSATGVADEQMGGMKDTMLAIYNDNFGENFAEIGSAMTTVSQQTGLAGDALKKATENGLLLKDTFELEVADSVKGANQLMKQFGEDSTTAYNLIAQGAQGGLNANGDLLDTLNEYGGTFAAQGFNAEEMFNMLSNASKSGIRDVDLAADAIKEFGIRSMDGSSTSAAGFEALGLNASKMTKAFAKGGAEGKAAFSKTTAALLAMKNPVEQNAAGVALFGTQFEDLGIKGITALVNTQGAISKTKDALGKINAVKYNTFGEAVTGIKRNLETGLLIPLGDQILPKLNEFGGWISGNMPAIKNDISYAMDTAAAVFGKVSTFIGAEVEPRFKNIGYIASDIANSIFPNLDGAGNGLLTTLEGLVTGGLNLVIDALKFVRDNSDLVKTAVEIAGVTFLAYQGALVAVTLATNLHTIAQNIQKGAIVAYNIAAGIATAAQWGYLIAMESGSIGLGVIAAAQWLFNAALTANPIGVVIVSLTALGVGIYALVKNWDSVTGAIEKAWSWLTKWNDTPSESKAAADSKWSATNDAYAKQYGYANDHSERVDNNADGTDSFRGGWSWVGEEGPELLNIQRGAQIIPNHRLLTHQDSPLMEMANQITPHAVGGIMTSPHIGLVAEAGPEAIIPLDGSPNAISLWRKAGEILGLTNRANAVHGITTPTTSNALTEFAGTTGPRGENGGQQSPSFLAEFARNEGGSTSYSNSSQPNITYAPVTTVHARNSSDKKELEELIRRTNEDQQSNFVRWLESYNRGQRRVSYGS